MPTFRVMDLIEGANNAVVKWGNLKRGENLLIVTDTKVATELIEALTSVGRAVGATVTVAVMTPFDLPHMEPPKPIAAAMKEADLVIGCLTNTMSHTKTTNDAQKAGARFMNIGSSPEAMASKSAKFPPEVIFYMATKIAGQWKEGKQIAVKCSRGSHLTAELKAFHVIGQEGAGAPLGSKVLENRPRRSRFGAFEGGFGTVGVWPEWSAEGVAYFDAAHGIVGLLDPPLKTTVEKGSVVKLEGDPNVVAFFEKIFKKFGPEAKHVGEIMIGLNPWVDTLAGLNAFQHLQAHRAAGTVHICFGNSVDDYRTVKPGIHLDQLIIKPTILIDDQVCVENGRLAIYDDPDFKELCKEYHVEIDA